MGSEGRAHYRAVCVEQALPGDRMALAKATRHHTSHIQWCPQFERRRSQLASTAKPTRDLGKMKHRREVATFLCFHMPTKQNRAKEKTREQQDFLVRVV